MLPLRCYLFKYLDSTPFFPTNVSIQYFFLFSFKGSFIKFGSQCVVLPTGGGHDNPLQYSCLENPMDRGTWQATVHRAAKSQT